MMSDRLQMLNKARELIVEAVGGNPNVIVELLERIKELEEDYTKLLKRDTKNLQRLIDANEQLNAVRLLPEKWRTDKSELPDVYSLEHAMNVCSKELQQALGENEMERLTQENDPKEVNELTDIVEDKKVECPTCGFDTDYLALIECPHCGGEKCPSCDMGNDVGCMNCETV